MRVILIALFTLFFSSHTFSQVQQFKLNNGLNILVKEDHRAPVVVSMIWYNIGSADEAGGVTGTSHALEHLMFKGTKRYPLGVFSKTIAAIGGQENAFTSNDYTAYYEKTAAKHLAISFELEADRMHNLLLNKEEFAKEINVIQEERRSRTDNNPQALTFERFLSTAHLTAPYNHPVIGWMSDLKQMRVSDAKSWYQRFYVPNNATLVVVGDVNPVNVYELAKKYFGKISTGQKIKRRPQKEPPRLGKKSVEIHSQAQIPMIMIGFTVPTVATTNKDDSLDPYVLEVIASILDAGESARVSSQLVRGKQVASSIDVFYNLYARYQTQFILYGSPSQNHTPSELKKAILVEIKRLQTETVGAQELSRVKTQIIAQKTFEKDSIFGQAMELGLLETVGMGWQTADKYTSHINAVSAQQIKKAAQRYFQENNMTEALLIPIDGSAGSRIHQVNTHGKQR